MKSTGKIAIFSACSDSLSGLPGATKKDLEKKLDRK